MVEHSSGPRETCRGTFQEFEIDACAKLRQKTVLGPPCFLPRRFLGWLLLSVQGWRGWLPWASSRTRVWPARFGVVEALTRRGSHLGLFGHDSFRSGDCGEEADRPRSAEGRDKSCKRLEVRNVAF